MSNSYEFQRLNLVTKICNNSVPKWFITDNIYNKLITPISSIKNDKMLKYFVFKKFALRALSLEKLDKILGAIIEDKGNRHK